MLRVFNNKYDYLINYYKDKKVLPSYYFWSIILFVPYIFYQIGKYNFDNENTPKAFDILERYTDREIKVLEKIELEKEYNEI